MSSWSAVAGASGTYLSEPATVSRKGHNPALTSACDNPAGMHGQRNFPSMPMSGNNIPSHLRT